MTEGVAPAGWKERWVEGRIGFHQDEVNAHLVEYWPRLVPSAGARVLVPLCGKTSDMLWLRERGHEVVGVELSELACRAFFEENEIPFTEESRGGYRVLSGGGRGSGIELVCGDFFALEPSLIGPVQAWYDRAAVVALPSSLWPRYSAALAHLLLPGSSGLMLTFEYPQSEREGPPYSVSFEDVTRQFGGSFSLQLLDRVNLTAENRWALSEVFEPVVALAKV